ncbi:hypothetical protein SAMN06264849_1148 [Melghirimyces algeriensis]|uniref:Uncharacterized protein n=1 Tax=Melghirimyces algeriensis TaxID=910412 RepID=A0A521F772_9BACL|nr:hypothetical protein SAMN06264849_1148 [Melghirimyces algeriensis]
MFILKSETGNNRGLNKRIYDVLSNEISDDEIIRSFWESSEHIFSFPYGTYKYDPTAKTLIHEWDSSD